MKFCGSQLLSQLCTAAVRADTCIQPIFCKFVTQYHGRYSEEFSLLAEVDHPPAAVLLKKRSIWILLERLTKREIVSH
jgi:hypothetical protein